MKYRANPVEVDAFKIVSVRNAIEVEWERPRTGVVLGLENGEHVRPTNEMMARMRPSIGDYWVVQSDGYVYLNPAKVFERKYSAI